jgi:uncharacterized protein HemX
MPSPSPTLPPYTPGTNTADLANSNSNNQSDGGGGGAIGAVVAVLVLGALLLAAAAWRYRQKQQAQHFLMADEHAPRLQEKKRLSGSDAANATANRRTGNSAKAGADVRSTKPPSALDNESDEMGTSPRLNHARL